MSTMCDGVRQKGGTVESPPLDRITPPARFVLSPTELQNAKKNKPNGGFKLVIMTSFHSTFNEKFTEYCCRGPSRTTVTGQVAQESCRPKLYSGCPKF